MRTASEIAAVKAEAIEVEQAEIEQVTTSALERSQLRNARKLIEIATRKPKNGAGKPSHRKYKAKTLEQKVKVVDAVQMRIQGYSYQDIRDQLGFTTTDEVRVAIDRILADYAVEATEELRVIEAARLDHYLVMLEELIDSGHVQAIDKAIKVQERRARLMGLDKPVQINATGEITVAVKVVRDPDWN